MVSRFSRFLFLFLWSGCALYCAFLAAEFSLRTVERFNSNLGIAAKIYPQDGIVRLNSIFLKIAETQSYNISQLDADAIKATLRGHPLNARALSVLGLHEISRSGSDSVGAPYMELADRLSRRDPISQLWLIEAASNAGNVGEAIRHYNAALSVKPELSAQLFPVLMDALRYPEVQSALRKRFLESAPWTPAFFKNVASSAGLNDVLMLAWPMAAQLRGTEFEEANAEVVYRLAAMGSSDKAMQYAERIFPGFSHPKFAKFSVSPFTLDRRLGKLAWQLTDNESISAISDASGNVDVNAQPGARDPAMARDVIVAPNQTYELQQTIQNVSVIKMSSIRWRAKCISIRDTPIIWEQSVPVDKYYRYKNTIKIPSNCRLLRIELTLFGPEGQLPAEIKISNLDLETLKNTVI